MTPAVKGLIGVGSAAVSCYGIYELSTRLGDSIPEAPASKTIYQLFSSGDKYQNKFGSDFRRHFVGFKEDNSENKEWWDWSFKYRLSRANNKDLSEEFEKVTSGFGTADINLSKVCDTAYGKETKKDIFKDEDTNTTKEKYRRDIWTYCSKSGQISTSIPDSSPSLKALGEQKTTWGKHLQSKLVDTESNEEFWSDQQEEFGTPDTADTFFTSKLKDSNSSKKVKEVCKLAYEMEKEEPTNGGTDKPKEEDILKYCSLTRK